MIHNKIIFLLSILNKNGEIMINTVIFDMDGLLINSEIVTYKTRCFN